MFSRLSKTVVRLSRGVATWQTGHVDVLIVGGGIMGSSAAYWIKKEAGKRLNVCVVEKDMTVSFECFI